MATVAITTQTFETVMKDADLAIIDFWAPWCGPCRQFGPIFEKASEQHEGVLFGKINTEDEEALGAALGITSIPTLMVVRDGIVLFMQPGALPGGALDEVIAKAQEVDMDEVRSKIKEGQQALTVDDMVQALHQLTQGQAQRGATDIPNFRR